MPERQDIPVELTWDLTALYSSDAAWEAEFAAFAGAEDDLLALKGQLGDDAQTMARAFALDDDLQRRGDKLYCYAHLKADEDTRNTTYMAMQDRIRSHMSELAAKLAWFTPEVLAIPPERLAHYREASVMGPWRRSLDDITRRREHTLGEREETLLSMAAEPLNTPSKAFSLLSNADLTFPEVTDDRGEQVELTQGNFVRFLESRNREVRRGAFEALYGTYETIRNTTSALLDGQVRRQIFAAKARNFPTARAAALFPDHVPESVYDGLIAAVHDHLDDFYAYVDLRRRALGLDTLDMYDHYVPIVPQIDVEVPWEQACDWARAAVAPLGKAYGEAMESAFRDRWIDVLECRGKRSGGYSSGCYDSPPYILLNYQDNLDSAYTLIHELGHSMHSYLSNRAQPHQDAPHTIFVAEVASTTNEMLLTHHLLSGDPEPRFRAFLLNKLCDQFKGTVFRQTMFAEFEAAIHAAVENGEPLTPDALCRRYFDLNATYYGPGVEADRRIQLEWARIPHFYYNFYVYKYATGFCAAQVFSQRLLAGEPGAVDDYLGFLEAGRSKPPLDILAAAGCDLRDPAVIDAALTTFRETVGLLDTALAHLDD